MAYRLMTPADLTSLLAEQLPARGPITASAGEWRLAKGGLWHLAGAGMDG